MNLEKWVNILVGSLIVIMVLVFSIKYFFDASEKIVLKDPYKKSMKLGIYIKKGNYKGIEDLLKSKMDVNYPTTNPKDYNEYDEDLFPVTPLLIACKKGDLRSVKLLLENGAVTSIVKGTKWSPLHESLWWGYHENDYEIVKLLIQHGSDVNLVEDGTRPLTIVSWKEVGNGKMIMTRKELRVY